jgi:hypothetical protein
MSSDCTILVGKALRSPATSLAIGEIAGYAGCQKLCETIHTVSALSQ